MATLTFESGQFILNHHIPSDVRAWTPIRPHSFSTTKIKAAAEFRRYADNTAKIVFKRTFNQFYGLPTLPPLKWMDLHQIAGVSWALSRSRSYLAHAPGAGKTAQMITVALLSKGTGQNLIIIPPSLVANWEREIEKFRRLLGLKVSVAVVPLTKSQSEMNWSAEIILCPDSRLAFDWVIGRLNKMSFKTIGVDEASRFKEFESQRAVAFYGGQYKTYSYPGIFRRARHTVFLDGSPMPNRPMELWAPLYALVPESIDHMSRHEFGVHFCGAKKNYRGDWEYRGSANEAELRERMQRNFMHVVHERDLSHPERRRSLVFTNNDVRSPEHKAWERRHLGSLNLSDLKENIEQGDIARFRRELGLRKVPWTVEYISERLKNKSESILVFAWHREVCEALAEGLKVFKPGLVMGGTKDGDKEKYFREFQTGERRIIVGNILVMGRGHNLPRADRAVFCEPSWSDESNKQCEKRASRRGRDATSIVRCDYVVALGSMDEPIINSLFTKESRVKKVMGA